MKNTGKDNPNVHIKSFHQLQERLNELKRIEQERVERILARDEGGDDYQNRKPDKKLGYITPQDSIDPNIEKRLEKIYPRVEAKLRRQKKKNEEKEQKEQEKVNIYTCVTTYFRYIGTGHLAEAINHYKKGKNAEMIINWFIQEADLDILTERINAWISLSSQPKYLARNLLKPWKQHVFQDICPKILVGRPDAWSPCQIAIQIGYKKYPEIWKPFLLPDPEKSEQ